MGQFAALLGTRGYELQVVCIVLLSQHCSTPCSPSRAVCSYIKKVSGPVVVAERMAGCSMVRRTPLLAAAQRARPCVHPVHSRLTLHTHTHHIPHPPLLPPG